MFTFVFNCFLPSILPLFDIYFRFVFTLIFTFKNIFFACGGLVLILIFTFILLLFLPLFKKIFACGGLVFTLSLPLFLPLLLILCLPCILALFDLYLTLVFTLILLLCLPWFCVSWFSGCSCFLVFWEAKKTKQNEE